MARKNKKKDANFDFIVDIVQDDDPNRYNRLRNPLIFGIYDPLMPSFAELNDMLRHVGSNVFGMIQMAHSYHESCNEMEEQNEGETEEMETKTGNEQTEEIETEQTEQFEQTKDTEQFEQTEEIGTEQTEEIGTEQTEEIGTEQTEQTEEIETEQTEEIETEQTEQFEQTEDTEQFETEEIEDIAYPETQNQIHSVLVPRWKLQDLRMMTRVTDWKNYFIGRVSDFLIQSLELISGESETNEIISLIQKELEQAGHLALKAIVLPLKQIKRKPKISNLLLNQLNTYPATQIWLEVDLNTVSDWNWWNSIRIQCNNHANLHLLLNISLDLDEIIQCKDHFDRWLAEPIGGVILDADIFQNNVKTQQAKLSTNHAFILKRLMDFEFIYFIKGHTDPVLYFHALDRLQEEKGELSNVESFCRPYYDMLQSPLQPLMDNLESQTYEVFEKDRVKYDRYERAITKAIRFQLKSRTESIPSKLVDTQVSQDQSRVHSDQTKAHSDQSNPILCLMIVGAGRGPLIKASFRALTKFPKQPYIIYAVEKNPCALMILHQMKKDIWKDKHIEIIHHDMRDWNPPQKADILISELLGSFGDNELSPECLDGAINHLLKENGSCVPMDSTSYVSPISTQFCHNLVQYQRNQSNSYGSGYVVGLHRCYVGNDPKPCFSFNHDHKHANLSNDKSACLSFKAKTDYLLHGFIGYFESDLFETVAISILPKTYTKEMFSWFPMYFPIQYPMSVLQNQTISIDIQRKSNQWKVWYEWMIRIDSETGIPLNNSGWHNVGGVSYGIYK